MKILLNIIFYILGVVLPITIIIVSLLKKSKNKKRNVLNKVLIAVIIFLIFYMVKVGGISLMNKIDSNKDIKTTLVTKNKTSTTKYTLTSLNYANYKAQKEGSKFTGWRTNTTTCDDAKTSGTIQLTANLSLVACYEAESGGVTENPNTGSSLLYVVYLIGILALGYTGYYAYKTIKVKK